jgi:hypothetical protein
MARQRCAQAVCLLAALVLLGTACGAAAPASRPQSGIEGVTQASPACPVERLDSPCPARRFSTTMAVRDGTGHEVTRFTSAADGSFRVALPPGAYTLARPPTPARVPPTLQPVAVTVRAGRYTHVVLDFDSGIR